MSFCLEGDDDIMARSKYDEWITDEGLLKISGWAKDGLTDEQIAHNMDISRKTLHEWKNKYSDIGNALKVNKEVADRHIENALYKTALGYEYEEETVTNAGNVVKVKKYSKPNTTAQIFWLKNRKMLEWRDKQEVEQTNKNITINVGEWEDDE